MKVARLESAMLREEGPPKIQPSEKAISFKMPERKGMKYKENNVEILLTPNQVMSEGCEKKMNKYEKSQLSRKFEGTKLDTISLAAIVADKIGELNTDLDPTIYKALDQISPEAK